MLIGEQCVQTWSTAIYQIPASRFEIWGVRSGVAEVDVCVTVHHQYNDVSKQQDATTFSFTNLFKSTLHVSGDKFAHPQEQFLTVYTAFGTMHQHCCPLVPRLTMVQCTESYIYSQKVLLRMSEFVAQNM